MMSYWNNLNERERWTIGLGGVCLLIYIFYLLIYAPLVSSVVNKSKQLAEKQETLTWMQQLRQQPLGKKAPKSINSSKLLTLIATQLRTATFQKYLFQLQQTGQGEIQLTFDAVPYNQFLLWLWTLSNDYSIIIKQLSIDNTEVSGVVKLTVIIAAK